MKRVEADLYDIERIAFEIASFTGEAEGAVWKRLCLEMTNPGHNVRQSAKEYKVTPHIFDDNLLRLYRESDGFIYESLVESINPFRRKKWTALVDFLISHAGRSLSETAVLVYGDSVGSDSIYLADLNFDVYYHDFESHCSRFARKRFADRGLNVKTYSGAREDGFDYMICLEVAEHVPDPISFIAELRAVLKPNGLLAFSEAFGLVNENFPTHLACNMKYKGMTDSLFRSQGLHIFWRDYHDKPIVFVNGPAFDYHYRNPQNIVLSKLRRFRKC